MKNPFGRNAFKSPIEAFDGNNMQPLIIPVLIGHYFLIPIIKAIISFISNGCFHHFIPGHIRLGKWSAKAGKAMSNKMANITASIIKGETSKPVAQFNKPLVAPEYLRQ